MSDNKHGRAFAGRGYYIALILCAAAIGIMSYVYYAGQEDPAVQTANLPDALVGTRYYEYGPNKLEQSAKAYWENIKK